MMRIFVTAIAVCVLAVSSAMAMNAPKPKPGVVTKKKMYEAAVVLMDTMNKDGMLQQQMNSSIDKQLESMREMPCAENVTGDVRSVLNEALSYNAMKGDLANVYANNFTLDELEWMVDFYKTPLGTKMLEVQPVVYETMGNLSTARMKAAEPKIAAILAASMNDQKCRQGR